MGRERGEGQGGRRGARGERREACLLVREEEKKKRRRRGDRDKVQGAERKGKGHFCEVEGPIRKNRKEEEGGCKGRVVGGKEPGQELGFGG